MSNRNTRPTNAAFVFIVSLLVIIFIIVSYFMLSKDFLKNDSVIPQPTLSTKRNPTGSSTPMNGNKQVYHIRDNVFSYDQAKAICAAHVQD